MFAGWLFGVGGLVVGDRAGAVKLTRDQRAALFAGNAPAITGDGKCPWSKADRYELSSLLAIVVLRVDTAKSVRGESWRLHYLVDDRRDPTRLPRHVPPVAHPGKKNFDEHGFPRPVPEGEASEESGYTSAPRSAVPGVGGEPPQGWVEENAKQRRLQDLKAVEGSAKAEKAFAAQLRDTAAKARARGIDPTPTLDKMRLELDGLLRRLDDAA